MGMPGSVTRSQLKFQTTGRSIIQQRKSRHAGRMVECHAMAYARAPIMCAHSPGLVRKRLHGCNEVRS